MAQPGTTATATGKEKQQVDFWDLTKLVFRRWYIAVPLLILTGLAATYTTYTVKPDYKATAYVQLIPPPEASITTNIKELRNPWLDLGLGALNTAATYATVDRAFLNQLKDLGMSDNVVITNGYPAPIATVEVIGSSKEMAMGTTGEVVKRFNEVVKSLQDDYAVQTKGRILTRRLDTGNNLEETGGKVKRALVAVGGAGVLLTAAVTVAFDALMRRRSRRRSRREDDEPVETTQQPRSEPEQFPETAGRRARRDESEYHEPGTETVKMQVPNANSVPRQRGGPTVNGSVPVNGGARPPAIQRAKGTVHKAADETPLPPDATVVIPVPAYTKPGEGRGSKR